MNERNNLLNILAQGHYGNRTWTEVREKNIDRFILGYMNEEFEVVEPIDKEIVRIPNTDNIVVVYNKYKENKRLELKEEALRENGYELKPLVNIPENNVEIYSRCIVCRINYNGEFESLEDGDYEKFVKYLAE